MALPPFYTARYVEVHNSWLSAIWLGLGAAIVLWTLLGRLLGQHAYVERHTPNVDVAFWHDRSIDGSWWPSLSEPSAYCGLAWRMEYPDDDASWGSKNITCIRPAEELGTFIYTAPNEAKVAFSVANGADPQYNTSEIGIYEGIERSTLVFMPSFSTPKETVHHVPDCQAMGSAGKIPSRYSTLVPKEDYGKGYLMLSVEDILGAAGRGLDDLGSEGAPLRLSGLEILARVDIQNYHIPFRWPLQWNPLGLKSAGELECRVHFSVLRDQFTEVKWFYEGKRPVALQHGLRLSVVGSGSVGYWSVGELLKQILFSFTAFGLAQTVLDAGWFYIHGQATAIASRAYSPLELAAASKRTEARKKSD